MDCLPSQAMRYARIVMPARTLFEMDAAFVNQEGRIQFLPTAHCGGIPIEQISGGGHPLRVFRSDIPGNEPKAAWQILAELSDALALPGDWKSMTRDLLWQWMAQENPIFSRIVDGIRIYPKRDEENLFSTTWLDQKGRDRLDDELELLLVDWTFETEELSAFSNFIRQVEKGPFLLMHPEDASRANLINSSKVALQLDGGRLEVKLSLSDRMAPGVVVLPRHHQLAWQKFKTLPVRIPFERIKKV
jgi:NADH-quinone oxidoreductase subunit G